MVSALGKMVLKKPIFDQNGLQKSKFQKIKKVPLDILEIHAVSKFGPIWIKIAAGSLSEPHTHIQTFQYPGTLLYQHTSTVTLPAYLPTYLPT